jgi:hypothetical protein
VPLCRHNPTRYTLHATSYSLNSHTGGRVSTSSFILLTFYFSHASRHDFFSRFFAANPFSTLATGRSTIFESPQKSTKHHKNLLISASQAFSFLLLAVTSNSLVTPQPRPLTFSPSWLSKKT